MKETYKALGITPSGNAFVTRPITPGGRNGVAFHIAPCDVAELGFDEACKLFGHILIHALGVYHPDVDRYPLLPERCRGLQSVTDTPFIDPRGEMRKLRMGLGVTYHATGPALAVRTYDGELPIAEDFQRSLTELAELAELGKGLVPSLIGEIVLRKLAALHPDVLPPLFPTIFAPGSSPA